MQSSASRETARPQRRPPPQGSLRGEVLSIEGVCITPTQARMEMPATETPLWLRRRFTRHRHEDDGYRLRRRHAFTPPLDDRHLLVLVPDGDDHLAADGELVDEGLRY